MRRLALLALLLPAAGCSLYRSPESRGTTGVGVLVQGVAGRCAPVVVGGTVRRVCIPRGTQPPADTTAPDTAAVSR